MDKVSKFLIGLFLAPFGVVVFGLPLRLLGIAPINASVAGALIAFVAGWCWAGSLTKLLGEGP